MQTSSIPMIDVPILCEVLGRRSCLCIPITLKVIGLNLPHTVLAGIDPAISQLTAERFTS